MESLRGPTNSSFFGQKMSSECLEQAAAMVTASTAALDMGYPQVSFLQMLNGVTQSEEVEEEEEEEDKKLVQFQIHQRFHREANLQRLLEIQARYARPTLTAIAKIEPFRPPADQQVESCVTHASSSELRPPEAMESVGYIESAAAAASVGTNERKKRKRSRVSQPPPSTKNAQEVESQRMNHIAVERNRRRLMNSHLSTLRSLMPQSFVQRADQASIIARAIDFVKELEQLLLSLQAKKRMRTSGDATATATTTTSSCSASSSSTNASRSNDVDEACHVPPSPLVSDFLISPQYTSYSHSQRDRGAREEGGAGVDVEATVVQGHANLKIVGRKRRGQVVRGIAALEEIGLPVLHLNIASLDASSILYSLNLKVEEECKLGSADEIATAVYQIFSYINPCCD